MGKASLKFSTDVTVARASLNVQQRGQRHSRGNEFAPELFVRTGTFDPKSGERIRCSLCRTMRENENAVDSFRIRLKTKIKKKNRKENQIQAVKPIHWRISVRVY